MVRSVVFGAAGVLSRTFTGIMSANEAFETSAVARFTFRAKRVVEIK